MLLITNFYFLIFLHDVIHGRAYTIFLIDFYLPDFTIKHNTDYRKTGMVIRIEINVANMFARYISIAFLSTKPISSFSSP